MDLPFRIPFVGFNLYNTGAHRFVAFKTIEVEVVRNRVSTKGAKCNSLGQRPR